LESKSIVEDLKIDLKNEADATAGGGGTTTTKKKVMFYF
jgi:guanine nucleotide-binding protein subunit beta-2-like 1 protein